MRIRRAASADRDALTALQHAAYAENARILGATPIPLQVDYAKILREMEVWLADGAVGVEGALILEFRDEDMLIWSVAAHPHAREKGVGRELLALAHERARESGRDTIRLYTASVYERNIAWYARRGFIVESREALSDRVKVNMVKKLEPSEGKHMAGRLKGKIAFCTAAGAGIGQAVAQAFLDEGAQVIATDLNAEGLAALKGADCRKLDVLSTDAVNAMAKEIGGVDILFNCAGFVHHGSALTTSDEDWDFSFNLNVKSMHRTIRAFLPGMIARGGGSIVNISSIASSVRGLPNRHVYGASKAAVIGLTKAVAADFLRENIRCNAIGPGTVQSPSLNERIKALAASTGVTEEAARQSFVARQPMGRLGTAREIAMIAVYLASDEAAFTTGQMYMVDGGMTI